MRRRLLAPLAIFSIAWILRLIYLLQMSRSPFFDFLHLDPAYYVDWAKRIAGGAWLGSEVFEMSPLYSYLLAGYMTLFGDNLWLLRLLQISLGSLTCVLTWRLGVKLFSRRVGLLAGLGCAAYGPFFFYEGQVMKEFLTPLLATGALLLLLADRDPGTGEPARARGTGRLLLSGVLLGLAALVRDNFLVLAVALAMWLLWETAYRPREAALLTAGVLIVLAPVGLRNDAVGGDFVLTTSGGGEVFYIGNGPYANGAYVPPPWVRSNPRFEHEDFRAKARELTGRDLTRGEASHFWWRQGLDWMAAHPWRTARLWARKFALFWNDHELPDNYSYYLFRRFSPLLRWMLTFGPVAALAWAGILLSAGAWRRLLPAWIAGAAYMGSVLIFFNFARFRLPIVPILLVFAGHAMTGLWDAVLAMRSRGASLRTAPPRAPAAAALLLVALPFVYIDWSSASEEPFQDRLHLAAAYRQVGEQARAEAVYREVIRDADAMVRRHGGDPEDPSTLPGGITFVMALASAHEDLANVLMELHRPAEAAASYRIAARLSPRDASPLAGLAAALTEAGDARGAEAALQAAIQRDPDRFTTHFDLATLYYEQGRYEDALVELERARRTKPELAPLDLADYHYGMGTVLLAMPGRGAEARSHLAEALRLNPEGPHADEAREALSRPETSAVP